MADENSTTTVTEDGDLAVKTLSVSGTQITGPSALETTTLVQTDDGVELAIKVFPLGEGGGGGGGDSGGSSGLGGNDMPSSQYVDLTLPTTERTRHHFTAPEDGWFAIDFNRNGSMFFWFGNETKPGIGIYYQQTDSTPVDTVSAYCPVSKGDILGVWFGTNPSTVNSFRFYYTNGSAPVN